MALNFKKYESANKTVLGTVASLVGEGGTLRLNPRNLADESKQVFVVLLKADGNSDSVIASKELSKRIRSKEIKLSQLSNLNVTEEISVNGEIINVINMPASGAMIDVKVDANAPAYEPQATFNPEELVAF